jgi:hypothetical protein
VLCRHNVMAGPLPSMPGPALLPLRHRRRSVLPQVPRISHFAAPSRAITGTCSPCVSHALDHAPSRPGAIVPWVRGPYDPPPHSPIPRHAPEKAAGSLSARAPIRESCGTRAAGPTWCTLSRSACWSLVHRQLRRSSGRSAEGRWRASAREVGRTRDRPVCPDGPPTSPHADRAWAPVRRLADLAPTSAASRRQMRQRPRMPRLCSRGGRQGYRGTPTGKAAGPRAVHPSLVRRLEVREP